LGNLLKKLNKFIVCDIFTTNLDGQTASYLRSGIFTDSHCKSRIDQPTQGELSKYKKLLETEILTRIKYVSTNDLKKLKLSFDNSNKNSRSFEDIIDSTSELIGDNEFDAIKISSLRYLEKLPHKLVFDKYDTLGDTKKFENRVAYKRFKILKTFFEELLELELEWEKKNASFTEENDGVAASFKGRWIVNGNREFDYNKLSDGQQVLFSYVMLLFLLSINPSVSFQESIVLIDEPEMNLHPKAQIKLISKLKELLKEKGQLIIATHSLSIVANLNYSSIYLVRDSQIYSPSSNLPFNLLNDLMGIDEHYYKITQFLSSIPSWTMTNFMSECFERPEVIANANDKDPQISLFTSLLKSENYSVLDFGSGEGRLLSRVKESNSIWNKIAKYDCYDYCDTYNEKVLSLGANTIINDINELKENSYDIIIMINVLHEIPIKEWERNFTAIKKSLTERGFLAVIEDTEIPIGELPNKVGFLILDKLEFLELFDGKVSFIEPETAKYKERIVCSLISKENLLNMSFDKLKLKKVLEKLKESSLKKINEYRKTVADKENNEGGNSAKLGRLYALKANLYINSELGIKELDK
jgi:energy-coupling factor transporter ATP-binding protein EcfA2